MADFLDVTLMTNYVRSTPPENNKLMNIKTRTLASAFESGERDIQMGDSDIKLVDNVTNFYLVAEKPVSITLSDGTIYELMTQFAYGGENPISVSVSAPLNSSKITYSAGLKVKNY